MRHGVHVASYLVDVIVRLCLTNRFFKDLNTSAGIDLENIVYYRDETHYFVMTAKKHSLLYKGVLLQVG